MSLDGSPDGKTIAFDPLNDNETADTGDFRLSAEPAWVGGRLNTPSAPHFLDRRRCSPAKFALVSLVAPKRNVV